jgi:hypothetical protein
MINSRLQKIKKGGGGKEICFLVFWVVEDNEKPVRLEGYGVTISNPREA